MVERYPRPRTSLWERLWRAAQLIFLLAMLALIVTLLISGFVIRDFEKKAFETVEPRYYYGLLEQIDYQITAPVSGTVEDVGINEGELVLAGMELVRLVPPPKEELTRGGGGGGAATGALQKAGGAGGPAREGGGGGSSKSLAARYSVEELRELIVDTKLKLREEQLQAERYRQRVEEQQRKLEKLEKLLAQGAATQAEVEKARQDLEEAQFDLRLSELRIARREVELDRYERLLRIKLGLSSRAGRQLPDGSYVIFSPVPGRVVSVEVEPGEYVIRGSKLLELVRSDIYRLSFPVSQRMALFINPASTVKVEVVKGEEVVKSLSLKIDRMDRNWVSFLLEADQIKPEPGLIFRMDLSQF